MIGNEIYSNEQGRDEKGRFLPANPGETRPGAEPEAKGLDAVDATKNTKPVPGTTRIPDGKTADGQYVEVKAGGSVSLTPQVKEMSAGAQAAAGLPLVLVTQPGAATRPVRENPNIDVRELLDEK